MKLKLRPKSIRVFLLFFITMCSFFNSFGQCEEYTKGRYLFVFKHGSYSEQFEYDRNLIPDRLGRDPFPNLILRRPQGVYLRHHNSYIRYRSGSSYDPPGTILERSIAIVTFIDVRPGTNNNIRNIDDAIAAAKTNLRNWNVTSAGKFRDGQGEGNLMQKWSIVGTHNDNLPPDVFLTSDEMVLSEVEFYNFDMESWELLYDNGPLENCCPVSSLSIEPTDYLKKTDPDTNSIVKDVWNADDVFDFTKAFEIKDENGDILSEEDKEKVKWYVYDRSKALNEDFWIHVNPDDPYNTPEEYYFSGTKNVDQWGKVKIKAEYTCDGGTRSISNLFELEVLDIGMYFRNAFGDILRWNKGIYDKYPAAYNGFFDPNKNIVMHSHGWQPGANGRHKDDPVANPERERLTTEGIQDWHDDYNVLLFFWTQSAEHLNGVTPTFLNFLNPAARPIKNNPKWVRENGSESRVGMKTDPLGVVCATQLDELFTTTGFDHSARELRLVGHSFGAIMMTKVSEVLGNSKIDRLTWLDPATTPSFLNYYKDNVMDNPSILPPIEWYQSSAYDYAWTPFSVIVSYFEERDVYNKMISNSTYVRLDPLWEPGYPTGDGLLHGSAREHYYKSLKVNQPMVVKSVESTPSGFFDYSCPDGTIKSQRITNWIAGNSITPLFNRCFEIDGPRKGPSAAASLEDLLFYKTRTLEQVWGTTTVSVEDDRYAVRQADLQGYQIGQSYNEVDLSIQVQGDVDKIVLNWNPNNTLGRSFANQNVIQGKSSATPSYFLILNDQEKVIGFSNSNTYTIKDLEEDTTYNSFIMPIGSDGYPTGYDKVEVKTVQPTAFNIGSITVDQKNKDTWHKVDFSSPMYQPSVVVGPPTINGGQKLTMRVKNVTNFGFEFQFDEWDYLDGGHVAETISWIAVSKDVTNVGDVPLVTGNLDKVNHAFQQVDFSNEFTEKPVVFTQTTSFNDSSAVVTRVKNITTTGFKVRLQEEEKNDGEHEDETVSYIAFTPGEYGLSDGTKIAIGIDSFNHKFKTLSWSNYQENSLFFVASTQTVNGGDPVSLRYRNLSNTGIELKLEEEQSKDTEVWHANEEVGYLIYGMESIENASRASKIASTDAAFKLFPNPTTGKIFLNSEVDIKKATVLDINGRVLLDLDVTNKNQEIDVSVLKSGMYVLTIITDQNEQRSLTFIKS